MITLVDELKASRIKLEKQLHEAKANLLHIEGALMYVVGLIAEFEQKVKDAKAEVTD